MSGNLSASSGMSLTPAFHGEFIKAGPPGHSPVAAFKPPREPSNSRAASLRLDWARVIRQTPSDAAPLLAPFRETFMKTSSALRAALVALIALAGLSSARADEGFVTLTIYKAGWIIGGSGGSGVLQFH